MKNSNERLACPCTITDDAHVTANASHYCRARPAKPQRALALRASMTTALQHLQDTDMLNRRLHDHSAATLLVWVRGILHAYADAREWH